MVKDCGVTRTKCDVQVCLREGTKRVESADGSVNFLCSEHYDEYLKEEPFLNFLIRSYDGSN